jgi:hypothetical protein
VKVALLRFTPASARAANFFQFNVPEVELPFIPGFTLSPIRRLAGNVEHMMQRILRLIFVFTLSVAVCAQSQLGQQTTVDLRRGGPIFVFHTDEFWLNLHHFLYVLGRAENKEKDSAREAVAGAPADQERGFKKLSGKEQAIWREAVAAYAGGVSKKDIVFDASLPVVTHALANAGDARALTGTEIDPALSTILQRVAPIYRKAWWKQHRDANRKWQKSIQALVDRYGVTVLNFITNAYKMQWPAAGFPVHISGYSNWAGAYSTTGNLLVLSSQNSEVQGLYGLESIFHEGMHQWDEQTFEALRQQAIKVKKFFPRGLSHSLIFFTAGEAVRRAVGSGPGKMDYVPYAEKYGVYQRGMSQFKAALEEIWKPYLDGRGTRDEAFAALIVRTAVEPPKKNST